MKRIILSLLSLFSFNIAFNQTPSQIENLKTFAKTYGYIKYFHPSDEAANINWNNFSTYGAEQINNCSSQQEVINTLNQIYHPIAPSVKFLESKQPFDFTAVTPAKTTPSVASRSARLLAMA